MPKESIIQVAASASGLFNICLLMTLGAAYTSGGSNFVSAAVVGSLIASATAAAAWADKSKYYSTGSFSCSDWVMMFPIGAVISMAFLWIDCGGRLPVFRPEFVCDGRPGISVVFTIAALCLTAISLPSALRAWILLKFDNAS